jgi:hypothetical protein
MILEQNNKFTEEVTKYQVEKILKKIIEKQKVRVDLVQC